MINTNRKLCRSERFDNAVNKTVSTKVNCTSALFEIIGYKNKTCRVNELLFGFVERRPFENKALSSAHVNRKLQTN